jgi:YegS/Rv2252/BmrU family lipid kinase
MLTRMRATLIVNAGSGRSGRRKADELPAMLAARGIHLDGFWAVEDEGELRKRVQRAVKLDADTVIVGGGDGSMTTAVDVLAKRSKVLGVLPLGTGNSFARTIGLDDDLAGAIDALVARRIECVDLGIVAGTYFANFATIGLSAEIAEEASRPLKRAIGAASYVIAGLLPFMRAKPFRATIVVDGEKNRMKTQQIVIASGRYFGHQPIAPDATAVDHRLAFFTTTGVSHAEVARMYLAMGLGVQDSLPDAIAFSAREIRVKTKPRQKISVDGNRLGKTPATFRVVPRALNVIVGPRFDAVSR